MYPSVSKLLIYGTTCPILTKHKTLLPKVMEIQNWLNIYGPLSFQRGDNNNSIKVLVVSAMPVSHRLLVWVLLWFMMLCSKRRQGPVLPPPSLHHFFANLQFSYFYIQKNFNLLWTGVSSSRGVSSFRGVSFAYQMHCRDP